jgi:HEAT repeat protein
LITTLLGDRNGYVRSEAAEALGRMRPKPMTAVPRLLRCLDDVDSIVHEKCARALESIGHIPVEASDAVEGALTSPRKSVVARALRIISLAPQLPDTLFPALLKLMPEQEYVDAVIVALGNLTPCPPMAVRVLERLLALESKRSLVAPSLIKACPRSKRLLNTLSADLRAHDPLLRSRTVGWLALLAEHARPALGELRQMVRSDPDVRVRSAARTAIRRIVGNLR